MNIFQLKLFLDLIKERNFKRVARLNRRTQPAVTQQIKLLEDELEVCLFDRTKQKVEVTQVAKNIEPFARTIMDSCDAIVDCAKNSTGKPAGNLRIATVQSVGIYELSSYLKNFIRMYPLIQVQLEYRTSHQIYELVDQKMVDFGIVAYPIESKHIGYHFLKDDRMVVIVYPSHPLAQKKLIVPKDLQDQNFVAFSNHLPTHHAVADFLLRQGVLVKTTMTNENIDTLKNAVEIGIGISIVPEGTVRNEVKEKTLYAIPFKKEHLSRSIGILYNKGKPISSSAKLFLESVLKKKI